MIESSDIFNILCSMVYGRYKYIALVAECTFKNLSLKQFKVYRFTILIFCFNSKIKTKYIFEMGDINNS